MGIHAELAGAELNRLTAEGKIEVCGNLKIYRYDAAGAVGRVAKCAKLWRGKARNPIANYVFRDDEHRDRFIANQIEADAAYDREQAKRRAAREAHRQEMLEQIQIGTLLHYAWGWEQTNCEFFQVVERRGQVVTIRRIIGKEVPGSMHSHGMACMLRPAPDAFAGGSIAEKLIKRIGPYGITMPYGTATPCREDDEFYCSWYA